MNLFSSIHLTVISSSSEAPPCLIRADIVACADENECGEAVEGHEVFVPDQLTEYGTRHAIKRVFMQIPV